MANRQEKHLQRRETSSAVVSQEDESLWAAKAAKSVPSRRKKPRRDLKQLEDSATRHVGKFFSSRFESLRRARRRVVLWLVLIAVILLGIIAQIFIRRDATTATGGTGGTYIEGALGPIETLNPLFATSSAELSASQLMFSSLYHYDAKGSLHTDVATSLAYNEASKTYTAQLRDDVRWHDGHKLTAKDVVFTINLIKNPAVRSPLRVNWVDVQAKAVNDTTVQFVLPATYAAFPHALTFPILPEHMLGSATPSSMRQAPFNHSPVGSGPFKFQILQSTNNARRPKTVHVVAFDGYYGGRPKLDRFELQAYSTQQDIVSALQAGELSGATDLSVVMRKDIPRNQYTTTTVPTDRGVYLLMNNTNPILKDRAVRKALQLGTNTAAIRTSLGEGVQRLDGPFIPSQLGGINTPSADKPDRAKAAAMLDEAGWKLADGSKVRSKDGQKLEIMITTTKGAEYEAVLAKVMEQWQQLGVAVTQQVIDRSATSSTFVQGTLQGRSYDVLLYELAIGADPDVYAYWHSSQTGYQGYNFVNYTSCTADAALASARTRLEPKLRAAKYKAFAEQWYSDVPAIGLYRSASVYATGPGVQAIQQGDTLVSGADRYADVLRWTVTTRDVYKTP